MNILHLIESSDPGGAETVLLTLVKSLREKGHSSVIGLHDNGWLTQQLRENGFETIILEQSRSSSYDITLLYSLINIIQKYKIELIHSHEFWMNVYGTIAGFFTRRSVITTVHGKNYYWLKKRRTIAYQFVSRFSKMVAVSEDLRCFLTKQVGIPKARIIVVHNGINYEQFAMDIPQTSVVRIKENLSISPQSRIVGTIGMLLPPKDFLTFIRASMEVLKSCPDTFFLIIGEGYLKDLLRTEVDKLAIEANVKFVGFRDDIPTLLHAIDVYVCSSISEGLSLSILEAMAAGKPLVATNVGGNPEIVVDAETGFLVEPNAPERLAEKISLLLKDGQLAHQLGTNGQRRVSEKFSLQQMVKAYEQLYAEALFHKA